jgi:hypothetical protein
VYFSSSIFVVIVARSAFRVAGDGRRVRSIRASAREPIVNQDRTFVLGLELNYSKMSYVLHCSDM